MKNILAGLLCCITLHANAQTPKWAEKAKKAVFSVVTYDDKNNIKGTGNGFYIGEDGTALSDYTLFDNAARAVVITANGKETPVTRLRGANSIYDVLKFKTDAVDKIEALRPTKTPAKIGDTVYLLPYSTQKNAEIQTGKVTAVDSIGRSGFYYTLSLKTTAKTVSCPVLNVDGQVLGMIQRNASEEDPVSYAIGADFGASLEITALSATDPTLNRIHIQKALPDTEQQALVYLYMISTTDPTTYVAALEDFLSRYPHSYEGYIRRAVVEIDSGKEENWTAAQADLDQAITVADNKAEAKYRIAKVYYNYSLASDEGKGNPAWSFDRALNLIREANVTDPQPIYLQLEGDILYAMKHYPEAFECYQKVNESDIASAATFYAAARAKQMTEGSEREEILALLDSAVAKCIVPYTADAAPYLFERGMIKMNLQDYRGAVKDFNETYRAYNGNVNANFYFQREQAEINCRMYQQAIDDINRATELAPDDAVLWLEKGSVHIRVGQLDEAIVALQKVLSLDGNVGAAYRMLGYCQAQQKQTEAACANFKKAKELGDETAEQLMQKYCK